MDRLPLLLRLPASDSRRRDRQADLAKEWVATLLDLRSQLVAEKNGTRRSLQQRDPSSKGL
jgi:hypothetical protein